MGHRADFEYRFIVRHRAANLVLGSMEKDIKLAFNLRTGHRTAF